MNSTTKTVVASTTAALAIATGVFVATYKSNEPIDWNSIIPNINQYSPEYPNLNLETNLNVVDLNLGFDQFVSDEIKLEIKTNIYKNEDYEKYIGEKLNIVDVEQGLSKAREIITKAKLYFKDERNVESDKLIANNEFMEKWFEIYNNYKNKSFDKIPLNNEFRMISEIKLPKNREQFDILEKNLEYYKSRGYNSVLISFNGGENHQELSNLVKYIRYKGFRSYFTFGGEESLYVSVFVNPDKLKKQLQSLAEYSEGFILGWRRTSSHLFEQDIQYMNYMTDCVRSVNKNCLIIGEVYYGNTAKYPHQYKYGFGYNLPNYASATLIVNFGFSAVKADSVVKEIIPEKIGNSYNQIAVVVGTNPYFLTKYKNNLTQEENQKEKEKLELKFKNAGCKGTITFHDDGSDGIYNKKINNNLSEIIYTSLK